jgi:hypothetical protein
MTPNEQLAAIRELTKSPKLIRSREPAYEYMSLKIDQVDFLLARIDTLTAERDKELNDHRKSALYYEDQLETFRGHLEKLTAELAAANQRIDVLEKASIVEQVATDAAKARANGERERCINMARAVIRMQRPYSTERGMLDSLAEEIAEALNND